MTGRRLKLSLLYASYVLALSFALSHRRSAGVMRIDREVLIFFFANRSRAATFFMIGVTMLGEEAVVLIAAFAFGILSYTRSRDYLSGILLGAVSLCSVIANKVVKKLFMSERPPLHYMVIPLTDLGFPSAHAMNALSVYGTIVYLVLQGHGLHLSHRCAFASSASLMILMIGLSRIYLGEHWLSDIVGGWAFGALLLGMAMFIDQRLAHS